MLGIRIQVRVILTKIHRLNHFGNLKTTSLHPRIVTLQQHMDIHILRLPKREQAPQINCLSPFTKKSIPFTAAEVSSPLSLWRKRTLISLPRLQQNPSNMAFQKWPLHPL